MSSKRAVEAIPAPEGTLVQDDDEGRRLAGAILRAEELLSRCLSPHRASVHLAEELGVSRRTATRYTGAVQAMWRRSRADTEQRRTQLRQAAQDLYEECRREGDRREAAKVLGLLADLDGVQAPKADGGTYVQVNVGQGEGDTKSAMLALSATSGIRAREQIGTSGRNVPSEVTDGKEEQA